MERDYEQLCIDLSYPKNSCISRVQLSRILSAINQEELTTLTNNYFKKEIKQTDELEWFAIDGKELRGSINKSIGQKRGDNIIFNVNHQSQESQIIAFYSGKKDSEKTVVKNFFEQSSLLTNHAFSLDALHNSVELLSLINSKQAIYLTQIKNNQKHLLNELIHIHKNLPSCFTFQENEKGHGRVEIKKGTCYSINTECLPSKWVKTNIQSFICIEKEVFSTKTNKTTKEKRYYISNLSYSLKNAKSFFQAIRKHWKVEINNYIRDVSFGEDHFHSLNSTLQKNVSIFLNLIINKMRKVKKDTYFPQFKEECVFNRKLAIKCFDFLS